MPVVFHIEGVAEQGPPLAAAVLHVMAGVEQVAQAREVFVFHREVSR